MDQARRNEQCVRLGDSELLRCIRRIRKSKYSPEYLAQLLDERGNILSKKDKKEHRQSLIDIENKIDDILFMSDIISIKFSDTRHYEKIIKNGGILLNGKKYIRLLCGSGNARNNTVFFCNTEIIEDVRFFLNCGRNPDYKINKNKFNSYYALANSGSHPVSTPIFVIVPDAFLEQESTVDNVIESSNGKDAIVREEKITQSKNLFDGMGIIDVDFAWQWAEELELSYLPSSFIFRMPFGKGLITVFPFKEFAKKNNVITIKDIYGKDHLADNIDVILTESQFKLVGAYESIDQYRDEMKKHNFSFSISRISPEYDKSSADLCYQYIQCLNIEIDIDIKYICKNSIDWLKNVSLDQKWILLFLLSGLTKTKMELSWFEKLSDPIIKALLLEPSVANDEYIQSYVGRMLRKTEKEFFIGRLKAEGNYQFVVCDPVSLCQHAFGLPNIGILAKGESYSQYWNNKNIDEITAFRSPTTGRSEPTLLHLEKSYELDEWFKYQGTNIIFNIYDDSPARLAGLDFDGDLVFTTPLTNKFVYGGNIPYYLRKTAEKENVVEEELWKGDVRSFKSPVGILTNLSTSIFSMLSLFKEGSKESNVLIDRLKIATAMQNQIIDSQKGVVIMPFPDWWQNKEKKDVVSNLSEEEKELYENVRITKRPYFFRYLYDKYAKEYKKHLDTYEFLSQIRTGMSFAELQVNDNRNSIGQELVDNFTKYSPLLDSYSIMNKVCHYMEQEVGKVRKGRKNLSFDYHIYLDNDIELDNVKLVKMRKLYLEFSNVKRSFYDTGKRNKEQKEENLQIFRKKLYEISSNISELTNLIVHVCYVDYPKRSKDLLWKVFPNGLLFNLNKNNIVRSVELPFEDENGEFEYLNKKYSFYTLNI